MTPPAVGPSVWTIDSKGKKTRNADSPQNVCSAPTSEPLLLRLRRLLPVVEGRDRLHLQERGPLLLRRLLALGRRHRRQPERTTTSRRTRTAYRDLNPSAPIVSALGCIQAGGSTSYSLAVDEAAYELQQHGRANVQDVIVFFADGGANTWPNPQATGWPSSGSPWKGRPCGSASRRRSAFRGTRRSTRSATTSRTRPRRRSAAQNPARAATRTTTSRPRSPSRGAKRRRRRSGHGLDPGELLLHGRLQALRLLFARVAGDVLTNATFSSTTTFPTFWSR